MKKNFIYALLSATALLGAATFTSCKSDPEVVNNPNYDPETNMVNTQFVLNVASYPTNNTRQSSATVQKNNNFRGLQNAQLIALKTGASGIASFGAPYNGATIAGADMEAYDMGTLYTSNYLGTGDVDNAQKSHRILRMKLPVGSDAMLVYARAIPNGTDEANGKVTYSVNTSNPSATTFSLVPRIGNNGTKYTNTCTMIAKILNYILETSVESVTGYSIEGKTYSTTATLPALTWSTMNGTTQLETILKNAYAKLTNIQSGEYRDGSTKGVLYQIYNLAVAINNVKSATSTTDAELNAQRLAIAIGGRIDEFFKDTGSEETTKFQKMSDIGGIFETKQWEASFNSTYTITDTELETFPASFGLPHGVALLFKNTDGKLSYENTSLSLVGNTDDRAPGNFMYPAELLYFDNSTLRVNNNEVADSEYPDGYSNWNTGFSSAWTVGPITTETKSIAVTNNINYGVAMLKTKVALAPNVSFKDNRKKLTAETSNQEITVANNITLNGVLIGGQNSVGWNYLSSGASAGTQIIYDNNIVNATLPTPGSGDNYTLVFDNYIVSPTQSPKVYVALEFKNGNKAFYGEKNLIPANGYFYLVGELVLADKVTSGTGYTALTWDDSYPVPPYATTDGSSTKTERIFIQDHVTDATFTIGEFSLQHAYLTVPDMREVQTSLGLSVDLQWLPGLTFESLLGGGEIQ